MDSLTSASLRAVKVLSTDSLSKFGTLPPLKIMWVSLLPAVLSIAISASFVAPRKTWE